MKKLFFSFLTVLVLFLVFSVDSVYACKCIPGAKGSNTCTYYWRSASVFIGKVEQITTDEEQRTKKVTFSVEKLYRGKFKDKIDIYTAASGAACGYPFKLGERYFVYGYKAEDGKFQERLCGPTVLLKNASDDLNYAKEAASGKFKASLFGKVYKINRVDNKRPAEVMSDVEVTFRSESGAEYKTKTDKQGFYKFPKLPDGIYYGSIKPPNGYVEETKSNHLVVVKGDYVETQICHGKNFVLVAESQESGIVSERKRFSSLFGSFAQMDQRVAAITCLLSTNELSRNCFSSRNSWKGIYLERWSDLTWE